MENHHIVQKAYLRQWTKNDQLFLYSIAENKIKERGPNWKGFKRSDYNVLDGDNGYDYFPEKITAQIDDAGLKAIKNISYRDSKNLDSYNKRCLASYFALQYLRVPTRRDENNKLVEAVFAQLYKEDFKKSLENDFDINKILKEEKSQKIKEKILTQLGEKSKNEFKEDIIEIVDKSSLEINNVGQSKLMLKNIEEISRKLFYSKWTFLISKSDTSFITSDNPCFVCSNKKTDNGILSLGTKSYFPLKPDLCLSIEPESDINNKENFVSINKQQVREINNLILKNSYNCVVARDISHLKTITSRYDFTNHTKSKEIKVYKNGDYLSFKLE